MVLFKVFVSVTDGFNFPFHVKLLFKKTAVKMFVIIKMCFVLNELLNLQIILNLSVSCRCRLLEYVEHIRSNGRTKQNQTIKSRKKITIIKTFPLPQNNQITFICKMLFSGDLNCFQC